MVVIRTTYTNPYVLQENVLMIVGMWTWIEVYQKTPKEICGPVRDQQKIKQLPDLRICGLKFGPKWEKPLRRKRSKNGRTRRQNSTMFEDREAYISLVRKMVNKKKTSKSQGESWKFQWRRRCLAKKDQRSTSRFRKLKRRLVNPTRFQKTKHACNVEAHEPTRQRLESSLPKDHEDHIAGKGHTSMSH